MTDVVEPQLGPCLQDLPGIEKIKVRSEVDYYGVSYWIAEKLKLFYVPKSTAGWKHGWVFADIKYTEQLTNGQEDGVFLVAQEAHADFLRQRGMASRAVGMPFVYINEIDTRKITRQPNSLLVMPPHSLPYTTHDWNEFDYVKSISILKDTFDLVVACIHQSCVAQGLWIEAFEHYEIPWVTGADAQDKNALVRMNRLFKSFEYMTTNVVGSHIVYAAYCGCKVSIYGEYAEYSTEDYKNDSFYIQFPFLLKHNLQYASKQSVENTFPFLFVHPKSAKGQIAWAEEELGKANAVQLEELRNLLGWTLKEQVALVLKRLGVKAFVLYKKLFGKREK